SIAVGRAGSLVCVCVCVCSCNDSRKVTSICKHALSLSLSTFFVIFFILFCRPLYHFSLFFCATQLKNFFFILILALCASHNMLTLEFFACTHTHAHIASS